MSDIALELKLPESAVQALQQKAQETNQTVSELLRAMTLDYLDRQASLAVGRELLRALPRQGARRTDGAPRDLAENHDQYLSQ
jgi:hypothetical protein